MAWKTRAMRFMTLADVAEELNVTVRQVYALVRSGELRGIQIGGRGQWRVETQELESYIQRQYERSEQLTTEDPNAAADMISEND